MVGVEGSSNRHVFIQSVYTDLEKKLNRIAWESNLTDSKKKLIISFEIMVLIATTEKSLSPRLVGD